ncbi:YheC/YheD family protein [Paenibacillus sp. PL91]|uniref:YheC/YheD family endospore coat-associated protein n=1 Tax=Paenibacillus sp. PL91 TaxID=2729538 RepID=UPI00145DAE3C|nr:YheC/YheD family protein [Paenibacillus sp. PL91]MBC9203053.1 YheC/YheD family protein [Paenibacillus sp. PL91]
MNLTKVTLQIQNSSNSSDESTLMLSEEIGKNWTIPFHEPLNLCFGSASHQVTVEPSSQDSVLLVSAALASKWGLAHDDELRLQYEPVSETIQIGPLIGVIVSRINRKAPYKPFGVNTSFCRELSDACKLESSVVFFFTQEDVQKQTDSIKGWVYTNKWVSRRFPIPKVIYNRITSRKLERRASFQQFVKYAKARHNVVFFNEKYLNKIEVFHALKKEPELHVYLPESHLLRNFQALKTMCNKYDVVFLKPTTGSLGIGIIRIHRNANQTYTCHFNHLSGVRTQTYMSIEKLFHAISSKVRKSRYQIQRGLRLLTVAGRPVDFRALVQRGETGQWSITSIVARIAGNEQFVSNLARGGTITTVRAALARSNASAAVGGLSKLRRAALHIAKGIENRMAGHFAELGIDLALDSRGQVWLIEVNSKPSKDDTAPLSTENKIRPSVKKFVQYAHYSSSLKE